jgi:aquaporin Z
VERFGGRSRAAGALAELVGTAIVLFTLVSARVMVWDLERPVAARVPSPSARVTVVAVMTGLAILAVVRSPLGRLSGGHLNPAVTLAFALQGMVAPFELVSYPIAQCVGAVLGAAGATFAWGEAADLPHVARGVTSPAPDWSWLPAIVVEATFVMVLLLVTFEVLSRRSMLRSASLVVPTVLVVGVSLLARRSGAGFNPARALGPDIAAGRFPGLAIYLVGPIIGAALASLLWSGIRRAAILTPKLDHRSGYPCFFLHCRLHGDAVESAPSG